MGMPVMIALWDFMKSKKSQKCSKILDFHQFWSFCWTWPHLEISKTPNRPDNVEKHEILFSNFFKRFWNVRFREKKCPRTTLDGYTRHDRTMRFYEISKSSKILRPTHNYTYSAHTRSDNLEALVTGYCYLTLGSARSLREVALSLGEPKSRGTNTTFTFW